MSHLPESTVAADRARRHVTWRTLLTAPTKGDILTTAAAIAFELNSVWLAWAGGFMAPGVSPVVVSLYYLIGLPLLAWRHIAPFVVFALVWAHQIVALLALAPGSVFMDDYLPIPWAGVFVAVAALASDKPVRVSVAAAIVVLIPFPAVYWLDGVDGWENFGLRTFAVLLVSAWLIGWLFGRSRGRIRHLQQLQEDAAATVLEERAQIAAELHDIVSHAVTVMTLHAAGARRIIDQNPARAAEALEVIERVGSQTMDELRRLLELMRANGPGVEALHSLHDLESLVSPVRSAGIDVQVSSSGDPRPLDPSVGHAAFRVVQEALTNVTKHAGTNTKATVGLHWTKDSLHVEVLDYGGESPKANKASGYGLLGLHERVALVGGRLSYGHEGHGFAVRAELPIAAQASAHLGTNID